MHSRVRRLIIPKHRNCSKPRLSIRLDGGTDGARFHYFALLNGHVVVVGCERLDRLDNRHAFYHATKHHMFAIQGRRGTQGNKKLRAVGVFAAVGHRQQPGLVMLDFERFVGKRGTINAVPPGAVSHGVIPALDDKVGHNSVDDGIVVMGQAEFVKIVGRDGDNVVKQLHNDASNHGAVD